MGRYALRRLLAMAPTLVAIITLSFVLVRTAPGSPFTQERAVAPEIRAILDARYGLDRPLWHQFGSYVWALSHGDLGPSLRYPGRSVREIIALSLPHSLMLAVVAIGWGLMLGIGAGVLGAWGLMVGRRSLTVIALVLTSIAQSMPSFVLGPLLVLIAAVGLRWLPPAGWGSPIHVLLPGLTLGTVLGSQVARLVFGSLSEVMHAPYVLVARAKGLKSITILWRHMLIPGMLPLITYLGPAVSGILVGSVATERIFCVPGLGPFFVDAALNRDYFLVMGIVLLQSLLLMLCNLAADLLCAFLDPRVRMGTAT